MLNRFAKPVLTWILTIFLQLIIDGQIQPAFFFPLAPRVVFKFLLEIRMKMYRFEISLLSVIIYKSIIKIKYSKCF